MVVAVMSSGRAAKRARRSARVSADLYDFFTFPEAAAAAGAGGESPLPPPFREGVRSFLSSHARATYPTSTLFTSLMTWQILLRVGNLTDGLNLAPIVVSLDVVEEDVTRSSRSVYCDHCRVVGWSGHPVCRKRYHFIIRSGGSMSLNGFLKPCSRCGNIQHFTDSGCKWCNSDLAPDNVEDWVYSQIEDHTHLLHGVIHSNGYAHLLNVNGREGGSKFISGQHIMDFWDRLCKRLAVRMVSVMDMSKKYGIDYRLLHAITKGRSWYGEWDYEFKSGSYALTRDAYQNAVETLSSMPITPFLFQGRKPRTQLQNTIAFYQTLSDSELLTIKDLFAFMLRLMHEARRCSSSKTTKKIQSAPSNVPCTWTKSDLDHVQQAMIKVLKAVGQAKWVTWRALRGAVYRSASPELLDYCLKHLGGVLANNGTVVNSQSSTNSYGFEFRLEPLSNGQCGSNLDINYPSEEHVKRDLRFFYDSLLHPQSMAKYRPQATRKRMVDAATKILDSKHFIKDYKPSTHNPIAINLWCHVELSDQSKESPAPPAELLVLPMNATVADLRREATKAFKEVYAMFKRFEVEELLEYGSVDDSMTLKFLVGTSGSIRIKGRCTSKHGLLRFRMERGTENWKVDCLCGTKDDDGERMLACDACGVWHHTRCAGIENSDGPSKFHCFRCISVYNKNAKHSITSDETKQMPKTSLSCRGESGSLGNHEAGSTLSVALSVG